MEITPTEGAYDRIIDTLTASREFKELRNIDNY